MTTIDPTAAIAEPAAANMPEIPQYKIWLMALVEFCALGSLSAPLAITLSLKVLQIVPDSQKEAALSLVTAIGAICALLANPVFGHLSDRTRSRFGRRRPWIVFGALGGFLCAILIGLAGNLALLTIAWGLSQVFYNATLASLSALLADQVPDRQRSKASGIFGAAGFMGAIPAMLVAALFAKNLWATVLVMPIIGAVLVPLACRFLSDPPQKESRGPRDSFGTVIRSFFFNPFEHKDYSLLWLQRFIMQFGYTVVGTYALYYLLVRLQMSQVAATRLTAITTILATLVNFAAAIAIGYIVSRRSNYIYAMAAAIILMAVSLFTKAFTANLGAYWFATIVAGLALGMYYAIDLASAMRVLPSGDEGRYLGVFNIAKSLPQSLAPALGPLFLAIGGKDPISGNAQNYMSLYLVAAFLVVVSFLFIFPLRHVLVAPAQSAHKKEV